MNQKYKSKFKADTDSSVVQFMVNNRTGKKGKAGILFNTLEKDFDQIGLDYGLDEVQANIVKFTEILQQNYNFVDTKFQFPEGSLPVLSAICYNLKNVDTYYQSEISHDSGGKFDTVVIIPRLMKKENFGVGDLERFCKELAQRQTEFEYIAYGREVPGGLHSRTYDEYVGILNPGYPFTGDNYNKSPFGSYDSASQARAALADKFGFSSWSNYTNRYDSPTRKTHWDDSSELW